MNMNELPTAQAAASPEVFKSLGLITRQVHDTLSELGVMPKLQQSAEGLSDARGRLNYIARKTGEAADKVLTAVESAKQDHAAIRDAVRRMAAASNTSPADMSAVASDISAAADRIDQRLTEIMMAQDFHDLTGQVVTKVVALAIDLEDSLVKLLVQAAPAEQSPKVESAVPQGPVIDPAGRVDVVSDQSEVDNLLASMGF